MHYQKIILAALTLILFSAPAWADRDDHRGRRHERHHQDHWRYRKHVRRNTVIVRPNVISIWPSYQPHYRPRHYYYAPSEVSMTCANGKEVTIRATGLSIDHMLGRANEYCAAQAGGNLYRIDLLSGNRYCREYQARVTVGGRNENSYGTACLQPDGSWEIVK